MHVYDVGERTQFVERPERTPPLEPRLQRHEEKGGDADENHFVDRRVQALQKFGDAAESQLHMDVHRHADDDD